MPDDEGFRRYLQAGMAWFSVTQQKAEGILRDLTDSGETAMGEVQKVFDRIVERGRQGSDELRDLVRAEIQEQVGALGLATKDDIARLEAKIDAVQATKATKATTGTTATKAATSRTAPPATKATTSRKAPTTKAGAAEGTGTPAAPRGRAATKGNPARGGSTTAATARKAARGPRTAAPSSPEQA